MTKKKQGRLSKEEFESRMKEIDNNINSAAVRKLNEDIDQIRKGILKAHEKGDSYYFIHNIDPDYAEEYADELKKELGKRFKVKVSDRVQGCYQIEIKW